MKEIKFGKIIINKNQPAVIIAEIACQHGGDLVIAKKLILAAKESGADIAKFQLHLPEKEMIANTINFWGGSLDDVLKKSNFSQPEQHIELMNFCQKNDIQYLCTPFCKEAADILDDIGAEAFKIGSGEFTNLSMLRHIAKKKKPIIASTGMCTLQEIDEAIMVFNEEKANFMLMNCTSEYPAKYDHLRLNFIKLLEEKYDILVGQSDHTREIYSAIAAVTLGAVVIEKHFSLPDLKGPDDVVSLHPSEFKMMVDGIHKIEKALSNKKEVTIEEQIVRDWAHHSVVAAKNIYRGEKINVQNVKVARPGSGIPGKFVDPLFSQLLFGKKAAKDLLENTILQWEDLED